MLRVRYDELEEDEWGYRYLWQGKPFTGIAFHISPEGQVLTEDTMTDGLYHGVCREWYESGKLKTEFYSNMGHKRFTWGLEWFENGVLKRKVIIRDGYRVKEKLWDEEGKLVSEYIDPAILDRKIPK